MMGHMHVWGGQGWEGGGRGGCARGGRGGGFGGWRGDGVEGRVQGMGGGVGGMGEWGVTRMAADNSVIPIMHFRPRWAFISLHPPHGCYDWEGVPTCTWPGCGCCLNPPSGSFRSTAAEVMRMEPADVSSDTEEVGVGE